MKPTLYWGCHFALGLMTFSAQAATWTVTTTANGGTCTAGSTTDLNCTLDAAVTAAGNGDTILFAPAVQTQTIFFQLLGNLTASVTIDGSPGGVVLDGSGNHDMFYITGAPTVVLSHLTFQHGLGTADGGALYIDNGNVTVDSCTFAHNTAAIGGAIYFNSGSLTILNSTLFDNHAPSGPSSGSPAPLSREVRHSCLPIRQLRGIPLLKVAVASLPSIPVLSWRAPSSRRTRQASAPRISPPI